jgi:hypothetical protein
MRIVFAVVAVSFLSTSAHATECYKLPWAERGECYRSDLTFPVRYDMCRDMVEERGYRGPGRKGLRRFFNGCMRELSRLSMNELSRKSELFGFGVVAWQSTRYARMDR